MPKKKEGNSGGYDTPESGFLWKPEADNGGLVILLPSKYRGSQVTLLDAEGNVVEQGRSSGYANGDREHFRFSQGGSGYANGTVVQVTTSDGQTMSYQVSDTASRWDVGGDGSTGGGGMSVGEATAAFGGSGSLGIQRPNVSGRLGNVDAEKFESPLSTLETIHTLSNIITGASKSTDSIMEVQKSDDVEADLTDYPDLMDYYGEITDQERMTAWGPGNPAWENNRRKQGTGIGGNPGWDPGFIDFAQKKYDEAGLDWGASVIEQRKKRYREELAEKEKEKEAEAAAAAENEEP